MHLFTDSMAALRESGYPAKRTVISHFPALSSSHQGNWGIDLQQWEAMHQAKRGLDMVRGMER
jgi:hypothetical protein